MLLQFPQEIIIEIASHLNFYSKLNLAKTCRSLNRTLNNSVLFEELIIPSDRTDEVLLFFKNESQHGSRVKSCRIDVLPDDENVLNQLSVIFPNLNKLLGMCSYPEKRKDIITGCVKSLNHVIQQCNGRFASGLEKLIPECEFKNLTQLRLTNSDKYIQTTDNYFHCLQNAPSLTSLEVSNVAMNLEMLEEIHKNCPHLRHLGFRPLEFGVNNGPLNYQIEPTRNLETFVLEGGLIETFSQPMLLEYIVQKYPVLKKLALSFLTLHEDEITEAELNLISPALIKKLVDRVLSLRISSCVFYYIMNKVDLTSANITALDFDVSCPYHLKMFESIQGRSVIQSLSSLTSLSIPYDIYTDLFNSQVILPKLRLLAIYRKTTTHYPLYTIYLDQALKTYPGLNTLDISDHLFVIDVKDINYKKCLSVRNLTLNVYRIEPQAMAFVRNFFPNLRNLKVLIHERMKEAVLEFPDHDLNVLDLAIFHYRKYMHHSLNNPWEIFYHVTTQKGKRMFRYSEDSECVKKMDDQEWAQKANQGDKTLKIVCKSLLELKCNDTIIF